MPAVRSRAAKNGPAIPPAPAIASAHAAFDLLPIGIGVFDADLCLVYANAPFGELRDLPPNLCRPGTPLADIARFNAARGDFGPGNIDEQVALRIAEIAQLRPRVLERDFRDGRRLAVRYTPVADGGVMLTYTDVTDARHIEQSLRDNEERYALVTQAVAEGIYDWNISDNALWVSSRLVEIFGWDEAGTGAGARPSQEWNDRVNPEDFELYRSALRAALKGDTPRLHCEYRIRLSSGEYRWVEDSAVPVRDETGWAVRLVGAVSDITERKENETALRDALEQQTATAEVLQVINSSPGDLAPVFQSILEKAHSLCGVAHGALLLYDGENFRAAAVHAYSEEFAQRLRQGFRGSESPVTRPLLERAPIVHIPDLAEIDHPVAQASAATGMHTALFVPLRKDDVLLGMISSARQEIRPFHDKEIALLQNFAAQAVIAMENARLMTETREALEQQTATAEILGVISSSPTDVQPTFDAIAESAVRLCGAASGGVFRFDGSLIHFVADYGWTPEQLDALHDVFPLPPGRDSITARAILTRAVVHSDPSTDPEFAHPSLNWGTTLSVPMLRDGDPIGAITITGREAEPFSEAQIKLVRTFADQAVIAIENTRLFNELQDRTHDLQESLEYQTATSDVLQVISRSTFDLQPVLNTLVETAAKLCSAEMGMIARREGDVYRTASTFAFSPEWEAAVWQVTFEPGRGSVIGRVGQAGETVHIPDLVADSEYAMPGVIMLGKMRTALGVPLLRQGEPIGVLYLARQRVEPFSERQIELVRTFADQAVIAIENTRLFSELQDRTHDLQESLEYQTATSDVLQVISRSTFDLQPVLDTLVETAARLCDADKAVLGHLSDGLYRMAASVGFTREYLDYRARAPIPLDRGTAIGRMLLEHRVIHIEDASADPEYTDTAARNLGQFRTVLSVPLFRRDVVIGGFFLARSRVEPFSERQIELVRTFADQAVIAIENTRLFNELQDRTHDLQESLEYQIATSDVLKVISRSTFDLEPVLTTVAETAARLCDAEQAYVSRRDGDVFRYVTAVGSTPESTTDALRFKETYLDAHPIVPGRGNITGRVLADHQPVQIADITADPEYKFPEAFALAKIRSLLGVPLLRESEPIGVLNLARQRVEPFSERQIELVRTFADQAVIAIENTRLFNELQERTRDLQESLEYQTATSDVLQVISRSTFDLQPVLNTLVETAAKLCNADLGHLFRREAEGFRGIASFGLAPGYREWVEEEARHGAPLPINRGSIVGRIALEGGIVHVHDTAADPEYTRRETVQLGGLRTVVGVPLLREGEIVGAFTLARQRVEPFSERQIELVRTFADQAVIAIENTRLITETQEALEQQTATAEVLQVINASPGDLAPVFDAMLEKALDLCGAAFGLLLTYDGERFHHAAMRGVPTAYREFMGANPPIYGPGTGPARILSGERVVHVADMKDTDLYRSGDPNRRTIVDLAGARSTVLVPLLKDDTVRGVITIYRQEVRPFSDKEIALLQNFAAQAVIAIENTRLLTELRESLDQQTATTDVLSVISSSPGELQPVFDTMLANAVRICDCVMGGMFLYEGAGFRSVAMLNVTPEFAEIWRRESLRPAPTTAIARLAQTKQVVQIDDLLDYEGYIRGEPLHVATVEVFGARTVLGVPMLKENELLGAIVVFRRDPGSFNEKQLALVANFASQAAIAIENTRLLTELRESLEQQTATAEILSVINASPGNLAPVFDAMLEKAIHLCDAIQGVLWTIDGERLTLAASCRVAPEFIEVLRRVERGQQDPPPPLRQIMDGQRVINISNLAANEFYRAGHPVPRAALELGQVRSLIWVALVKDGSAVGAFAIARREVRPFSDKQVTLLENFAAQAVIAMDNARLLDEIRQRQAELRVTFDNMGDGVAMFDDELRLAAWNMNFQHILDLPDAFLAERPTFAEYFRYLAARGEYGDMEAELRRAVDDSRREARFERTRPDGKVIEVRRNPVPGGGFVLMLSDITERKRAEAEIRAARDAAEAALAELRTAQASLIHAEKMASLGQLTAGIAHEIKNPLNFVNNFAGLSVELLGELKQTAAPGIATLDEDIRAEIDETVEMLTGNLQKIAEHGSRADGIVKSMLAHSRGSSGERQAVDINSVIEEALNLAYHGARAQDQNFNVTLERELDVSLARIELVPQDMTRVFLNLFGNGFYAANKRRQQTDDPAFRPTLTVATRDLDDAVEIRVRDNGVGISSEHRNKLFQPFFTTKPTGEGTGLGLSISYDIVTQEHGGTIAVDSEPGEFTEFTITLPRRPSPTQEGTARTTH